MISIQIERVRQKLDAIRKLDPQGSALFGAVTHRYQLNPPATQNLVDSFEAENQLSLPVGYREFLLRLGNGGAGPYYGLHELVVPKVRWRKPKPEEEKVRVSPFSSAPVYTLRYWAKSDEKPKKADKSFYAGMHEKSLKLTTQGNRLETFLVVDGIRRGQIWTRDFDLMANFSMAFWPEKLIEIDEQIREEQRSGASCNFSSEVTGGQQIPSYNINPFGNYESPDFLDTLPEEGPLFLDWYEHWVDAALKASAVLEI